MKKKKFKIDEYIKAHPLIKRLLNWAKSSSFWGFKGIPVYDIVRFIFKEAQTDDISTRANSMAFSFLLALFPAIIFLFTLFPMFDFTEDYVNTFRDSISGVLPQNAEDYIFDIVNDLVSIPRGGMFTLGFVLAFVFASSGIASMMKGFEKNYQLTFVKRNYFQRLWTAFKLTILLAFLMIFSIGAIVMGKFLLGYLFNMLDLGAASRILLNIARWILVIVFYHAVISFIYRFGAPTKKRFHYFSVGANVATVFMIVVSLVFAFFVNNFGTYNKVYGSIGALIAMLVWIQFNCTILLVGYEINASIAVNKDLISEKTFE